MADLLVLFGKINEFCVPEVKYDEVEALYAQVNDKKTDAAEVPKIKQQILDLKPVARALHDRSCLSLLLEISATIRNIQCECTSMDSICNSWDDIIKCVPKDAYLAFLHALIGLPWIDTSHYAKQLGFASASFYILSLTIPGAKGFHIFQPDTILHCMDLFNILELGNDSTISAKLLREYFVHTCTLCDDIKFMFRYVHFKDEITIRDDVLKHIVKFLSMDNSANFEFSNMKTKIWYIFDEVASPHNGEPEETIIKFMNITLPLHANISKSRKSAGANKCEEHISDWFIKCIAKYPRIMSKTLSFYIRCIVTNPIKTWKNEQIHKALDYAAIYDAALFTQCNSSCVDFLCDAIYAEEAAIRLRSLDLMTRIIQTESQVDWKVFLHEVSKIPREIYIIDEMIKSLKDNNNSVKIKAANGLLLALQKGSPNTQKIMKEGIMYAEYSDEGIFLPEEPRHNTDEIRYEKPQQPTSNYSFEGHNLVQMSFMDLPKSIYSNLLASSKIQVRRSGLNLIGSLVQLNPLVIYNTAFIKEMLRFLEEPLPMVRKDAFLTIDAILEKLPNCYPIVWIWCKLMTPMLHDTEPKNVEIAQNTFTARVLLNLKSADQTNKAEYFMPWVIIRTLLCTQSRPYLISCFHSDLRTDRFNSNIVSIIESHLTTAYSMEAWNVLNFISGKIKSKQPDALIYNFISMQSCNKEQNMSIALEVLANYVEDFSHAALNNAFSKILSELREGKLLPALIGKAFDLLVLIDNCSQNRSNQSDIILKDWKADLLLNLENRIISGIQTFPENHANLISCLFSYSEVIVLLNSNPPNVIISFLRKYIVECLKLTEDEIHAENEQILNTMIIIFGKFSIRDSSMVKTTCSLYVQLLKKFERPTIVNSIFVAITDLCKKHAYIIEKITDHMLITLNSKYSVNRMESLKCFAKLILQDQLKLRGAILYALLELVLDADMDIALQAKDFFYEYSKSKSSSIFQKCLIECPFNFNQYKCSENFRNKSDSAVKSSLKGEANAEKRKLFYNFLMQHVDDLNLMMYFDQLKFVSDEMQKSNILESNDGIATLQDIFYILKRICEIVAEHKAISENDESMLDVDTVDIQNEPTSSETKTQSGKNNKERLKRSVSKKEALITMEKSVMHISAMSNLISNDSLQKELDELRIALKKSFPSVVEYKK